MMCDPKQQQQQRQHYLDLKKLLSPGTRADLVEASLKLLLLMSADDEFLSILSQEECKDLICLFCDLLHNESSNRSLLFSILVNLTASRHVNEMSSYLAASTKIINYCLDQCICQPNLNEQICAVRAAQLLSNLTRHFPQQLANKFMINPEFLSKLMGEFASRIDKETTDADENVGTYLGFMLMNLATIPAIGAQLASADHLPRLSSMLSPSVGRKKRMAALETIFNLSLQDELHPLLLANDSVRDPLLSALLGPLADAEDELDEEETAKLPPALQYWEGQREMDPELWGRLLSTLYQLCATRLGRETLRQKGVYALLRQLDRARQRMDGGKSGAMGSLMGASGQMVLLDAGHEQGELDVLRALIGILVRAEEDMGLPGPSEMADSIRQLGMKHP